MTDEHNGIRATSDKRGDLIDVVFEMDSGDGCSGQVGLETAKGHRLGFNSSAAQLVCCWLPHPGSGPCAWHQDHGGLTAHR
ncbi:Uncharacterised protein [Mycobacteroides abscessus subsp. abscessus]|nr:Uncharacterised protein [Mycobacteroides abscessus subsp. abscessus]